MTFLANNNALIIDLRKNGGGTPLMTELLISYLYLRGCVHITEIRAWKRFD